LFASGGRAGPVHEDAEEPGLEAGASLEPVDAADHAEPRVLDDLLGDRPARHDRLGEAHQARLVLADELGERTLVAQPEARDELAVVGHRGGGYVAPIGRVDEGDAGSVHRPTSALRA
jgi:hypothetical protein